ncbi:dr1-associated corepressor homolog [Penaeus indicus]|uniref:dr1-associated corepressor homolog n=1 Tax=Penaeus indicus TaxID=29960 RepID=UPI00300CD92F
MPFTASKRHNTHFHTTEIPTPISRTRRSRRGERAGEGEGGGRQKQGGEQSQRRKQEEREQQQEVRASPLLHIQQVATRCSQDTGVCEERRGGVGRALQPSGPLRECPPLRQGAASPGRRTREARPVGPTPPGGPSDLQPTTDARPSRQNWAARFLLRLRRLWTVLRPRLRTQKHNDYHNYDSDHHNNYDHNYNNDHDNYDHNNKNYDDHSRTMTRRKALHNPRHAATES